MTEPLTEEERQAIREEFHADSDFMRLLDLLEQSERNVESLAERLEASEQDCVAWAGRLEQAEARAAMLEKQLDIATKDWGCV